MLLCGYQLIHLLYSVHDAIDVDNEKDYQQMAKNILEANPKKVKIIIDIKDVQQSCRVVVINNCQIMVMLKHVTELWHK